MSVSRAVVRSLPARKMVPSARSVIAPGASSPSGGMGPFSSPRGGTGFFSPAVGSSRGFSSSASVKDKLRNWRTYEPTCTLLGGFTSLVAVVGYGFYWVSTQSENRMKSYVDKKLVKFTSFQNVATGTHHDTVRRFNDAVHGLQLELDEIRSKILALEQKEFEERKELLMAAELIRKQQMDLAAAEAEPAAN